ncbi:hypothetical protein EYF80_058453 [Liparis tanakae]|uniref:Secreted protein n=1 Tax=Liparis tanakae TaxID=230148 RepID=A0A4Z2ERD3_9TELE|nr:hypothetical protein EYF80_058453 [Liparis tanakae]
MLLITSGVSTLLMTLGHAHLQGHEPVAERVVEGSMRCKLQMTERPPRPSRRTSTSTLSAQERRD